MSEAAPQKEFLFKAGEFDPIEEALKAIAIVHGPAVADRWRYLVSRINDYDDALAILAELS